MARLSDLSVRLIKVKASAAPAQSPYFWDMKSGELFRANRFIWLIVSSLVLLALFQVFWLRKVWVEQREALRQEADNVFQRSVLALQDSLGRRAMRRSGLSPDSLPYLGPPLIRSGGMPPLPWHEKTRIRVKRDSGDDARPRDTLQREKVQVFLTATVHDNEGSDRLPQGIDRLLLNLEAEKALEGSDRFVLQIRQDSIDAAELNAHYAGALRDAGLPASFELQRLGPDETPDSSLVSTTPARAGLLTDQVFVAVFPDSRGFVLRKTLPYGFFALFLFGITAAAFWAIWRSLRRQQRLSRLKNDFVANITHELKTPITTVGVALEALRDFDAHRDPARVREYLDMSQQELARLSLLVDKVLRVTMFEQQTTHLNAEALDLADLVSSVIAALRLQAERNGAHIAFSPPAGERFPVWADRMHLSSVVFNLLDNALKYGGQRPDIRVSLEKTGAALLLVVQDNGPGIEAEYREKVFEKFFRIPTPGHTHNVKGHGLGLSYAADVVRSHGGHIRVENAPEGGARFAVQLPAYRPE